MRGRGVPGVVAGVADDTMRGSITLRPTRPARGRVYLGFVSPLRHEQVFGPATVTAADPHSSVKSPRTVAPRIGSSIVRNDARPLRSTVKAAPPSSPGCTGFAARCQSSSIDDGSGSLLMSSASTRATTRARCCACAFVKCDLVNRKRRGTRDELRIAIVAWIECTYHRR
jgi:hypothetical protein